MNDERDDLIDALLDGSLSGADRDRLARLLTDDAAHAHTRTRLATARALGDLLREPDADFVRRVMGRLDGDRPFADRVMKQIRPIPSARRRIRWNLAAALILGLLGLWWLRPEGPAPAVAPVVADGWRHAGDGTPVEAGERLDGAVALHWGGRITVQVDGALRIDAQSPAHRLHLLQGVCTIDIPPIPGGHPFAVVTPHARVEVLGTRFQVRADDAGSDVAVERGRVRVRGADGTDRQLGAGERLRTAAVFRFVPERGVSLDQDVIASWTEADEACRPFTQAIPERRPRTETPAHRTPALRFDGRSFLDGPADAFDGLTQGTLVLWAACSPATDGRFQALFDAHVRATGDDWCLGVRNGDLVLRLGRRDTVREWAAPIPLPEAWHCLAVRCDASGPALFIDGRRAETIASMPAAVPPSTFLAAVADGLSEYALGRIHDDESAYLDGFIGALHLYGHPLSDAELARLAGTITTP